jgi:hypothetical protein
VAELVWHDITKVGYAWHSKEGKPDSLRVDYYSGLLRVASEWVCFEHTGYARQKAEQWWVRLTKTNDETVRLRFRWHFSRIQTEHSAVDSRDADESNQ